MRLHIRVEFIDDTSSTPQLLLVRLGSECIFLAAQVFKTTAKTSENCREYDHV